MKQLTEAESKLMNIIWRENNIPSKKLVEICSEEFHWKKSTTYTMLKKLCNKNFIKNNNAIVSYKITSEDYTNMQKKHVIEKYFNNSLPSFLTAFVHEKKLSKDDIQELETIIAHYKEENLDK